MNRPNELFSLKFVVPQYNTLFGKTTTLAEVIDVSRVALKMIGNLNLNRYSARGRITDYKFNVLCGVYLIKSVTTDEKFDNNTLLNQGITSGSYYPTSTGLFVYQTPGGAEQHINVYNQYGAYVRRVEYGTPEWTILNAQKTNPVSITRYNQDVVGKPRGTFINFTNEGNGQLSFDVTNLDIEVIFDTLETDEEGLMKISEKDITAICYFLNFIDVQKKYFMKQADGSELQTAKQLSDSAIADARAGEPITQNDRDIVFSQMLTANRKQYSMPYRT